MIRIKYNMSSEEQVQNLIWIGGQGEGSWEGHSENLEASQPGEDWDEVGLRQRK